MQNKPLWVFGYGSLVWQPGFNFEEKQVARLKGYQRSFCMWSIHHRGTEENPGLVLALDTNSESACDGVAFRVPETERVETLGYLRERELISSAYLEKNLDIELAGGESVEAVVFVMDEDHVQYCGGLDLDQQAKVIAGATGNRGPNSEYLYNVTKHLAEIGSHDETLEWLSQQVAEIEQ